MTGSWDMEPGCSRRRHREVRSLLRLYAMIQETNRDWDIHFQFTDRCERFINFDIEILRGAIDLAGRLAHGCY